MITKNTLERSIVIVVVKQLCPTEIAY